VEESKEVKKEELGLKDTVGAEVGKGEGEARKKNLAAAAKRDKALVEAHDKYVQATEAARKEYVEAKQRIYREFEEATK